MEGARRNNKKNHQGLKRYHLFWLLGVLCLLACVYGAVWGWYYLQRPAKFPVKHIIVEGNVSHVDKQWVVAVSEKSLTGSFFSLNLDQLKQILLQDPWLTQISFRRVWPNALIILLDERHAVARWGKTGLVTDKGVVFYPAEKTIDHALPELLGPNDKAVLMLEKMVEFNQLLGPKGLSVKQLYLSSADFWSLTLNNDTQIILGDVHVVARLRRLVGMYQKLVAHAPRPIASIDCRYPNGFAVSYKAD